MRGRTTSVGEVKLDKWNFNPLPRERENGTAQVTMQTAFDFNPLPRERENGGGARYEPSNGISIHSLVRGRTQQA